jgi:hypothetical protein
MINLPIEFWFAKNSGLALPIIYLPYVEKEISICFPNDSGDDYDAAYKKYKERKQIDELCVLFDKLTFPITYEEYISKTTLENKIMIENISHEEKDRLEK